MTNDHVVVRTRSGVEPTKLFTTDTPPAVPEHPCAAELRQWTREHLCRPHPDLGRPGPVCPYISHSIAHEFLWAAYFEGRRIDAERITAIVDDLYDLFPTLPPTTQPDATFKAVLAVFPDLTEYTDLDVVQRDQKTRFVREGLMLGQFYPGCTMAGLRNPAFPALDAPLPMLAVRHMAATDFLFLDSRHEWLEAYLAIFAPAIPKFIATTMADRLLQTPDAPN
ncbi:DUF6875 domain-containing protein [Nocardia higoensis]|uniref:DUF6875 domain-containing protein n=1 Tax=Nocardia higoensis TaxID=228599 RepID=UPI0002EBD0FD|nr:hypothetical protein [Nocardia higoensis]